MPRHSDRFRKFDILIDDLSYKVVATHAAHFGVAVLIGLFKDGAEAGLVKLVADFPSAFFPWAFCTPQQWLGAACLQFQGNGLAKLALNSADHLLSVPLDPRYLPHALSSSFVAK